MFGDASYEPRHEKTCFCHMQTTKAQIRLRIASHPRSLISTFVLRCLHSIIPLLATSKVPSLYLVSVAEQAGLSVNINSLRAPKKIQRAIPRAIAELDETFT